MTPLIPAHIPQRGEGPSCSLDSVAPSVVWLQEPLTGGLLHDAHLTGARATCHWTSGDLGTDASEVLVAENEPWCHISSFGE